MKIAPDYKSRKPSDYKSLSMACDQNNRYPLKQLRTYMVLVVSPPFIYIYIYTQQQHYITLMIISTSS